MLKAICLGINRRGVSKLQRAGSKAIATGATSRALLSTATQLLLLHHHQCCYTIQHRLGALPPSATAPPLPSNGAPIPAIAATAAATALANSCHCQGGSSLRHCSLLPMPRPMLLPGPTPAMGAANARVLLHYNLC